MSGANATMPLLRLLAVLVVLSTVVVGINAYSFSSLWGRPSQLPIRSVSMAPLRTPRVAPLRMSDFQENTIGVEVGDRVRIVAEGVKFYHNGKFDKETGFDPSGCEGQVTAIKFFSKNGDPVTCNRPVMVAFTEPFKFSAHFEFCEMEKL